MPQLFPSRADFTLTSPILRLIPEQRHFPHFVTSYLDGAAELFIVHLLYGEPLNSVCISVKVTRPGGVLSGYSSSLFGHLTDARVASSA